MPAPLKTFIIYSRHDAKFKDELLTHLDAFVRQNLIRRWVDSDLLPGEEWEKRIEQELEAAQLVLMLVSADALNSDFIQKKEIKIALEKKRRGAALVVPILVRDCLWDLEESIAVLQMLPKEEGGRILAVEEWASRSSAWTSVCRELLKLIQETHAQVEGEYTTVKRTRAKGQAAAALRKATVQEENIRHKKDEQVIRDLPDSPEMIYVEGGRFQMGSNEYGNEKPIHTVHLSPYWIGKCPVTFEEYDAYCQATGAEKPGDAGFDRGRHPVAYVSWEDAEQYCRWLSETTGKTYRLPTEAEWEFAARGGGKSQGFQYAGGNDIDAVAWYGNNSDNQTHPVGEKKANELGLHDMSGNVWEWCSDWYSKYPAAPQTNPTGPASEGSDRVVRGGSAWLGASYCRPSCRSRSAPSNRFGNIGFRLVLLPLR